MGWLQYVQWLLLCFAAAALIMKIWSWIAHRQHMRDARYRESTGGTRWVVLLVALVWLAMADFGFVSGAIELMVYAALLFVSVMLMRSALWTLDLARGAR